MCTCLWTCCSLYWLQAVDVSVRYFFDELFANTRRIRVTQDTASHLARLQEYVCVCLLSSKFQILLYISIYMYVCIYVAMFVNMYFEIVAAAQIFFVCVKFSASSQLNSFCFKFRPKQRLY